MKVLFKVLLGLLVLFVLVNFFLSGSVLVSRSVEIKRPINNIFMNVANLKDWQYWGPLNTTDSTIVNSYPTNTYGLNAQRNWTSVESGSGSMILKSMVLNEHLELELKFTHPFESFAHSNFTFKQIKGKTEVTWTLQQDYSFFLRFLGLFADSRIGSDFDSGLQKLKLLSESSYEPFNIQMLHKAAFSVYSKKDNCKTAEIGTTLEAVYGELIDKMTNEGVSVFGKPICWYHTYTDTEVELEAALPINEAFLPNEYTKTIPEAVVLKATYVGAYDKTQYVYEALDAFAAKNELKTQKSHYQIFITDPGTTSRSDEWVTEIYYTVE